jgi:hypothetical protein
MQPSDLIEFTKTVNAMALMKKSGVTADVMELWWGIFADWTLADFQAAAYRLLKTQTFMPQPNEFEALRRAGEQSAGEAFATVKHWAVYSPNGYTLNAATPRKLLSAIAAMGGINAYMMADSDKLPFLEKRFCLHFEEIGERMDTRDALPQIAYGSEPLKIAGTFTGPGLHVEHVP